MKPPISYYGGKQKIARKIIKLIPKHTVYVEPFAGGAAILFMKPDYRTNNQADYREVINDKDELLINFYRVLQDNPEPLINKLQLTLYSRAEHNKAKTILKNSNDYSALEKAWAYYVQIFQSFSTILFGVWRISTIEQNIANTWNNKVEGLGNYIKRMKGIHVESIDAIECIKKWDSPQTLFYCDPPYMNANQGYILKYSLEQQQELIDTLNNIQGSFLLSGYDDENIIISDNWERFSFEAFCSASGQGIRRSDKTKKATKEEIGNRKRIEVVWRKISNITPRPEILKIYEKTKHLFNPLER